MARILIVDDDRATCQFIEELLAASGREFVWSQDPDDAVARMREQPFDLLITDLHLNAAKSGLDVLRTFTAQYPSSPVILISGFGTLETAIDAVRAGAFDFISKPFEIGAVKTTVERALRQAPLKKTGKEAQDPLAAESGLLGRTAGMLEVYKLIARAADSDVAVLITGESGTGKELAARAIHGHGPRARHPFVAINCGAIIETLLESELFGHVRGSFTGAISDTKGLFEQAGAGTLFLDEIGEMSPALQVKLLRVLEEQEVRPVGGTRPVKVKARVIAATNIDVEEKIASGKFRQDLYYRLSVIVIDMPPLRERRLDIPVLVSHFIERAAARSGRRITLSSDTIDALMRYSWPGNVRELENTIERLSIFSASGMVDVPDLPEVLQRRKPRIDGPLFDGLPTLDELERRYLLHVLEAAAGSRTRAAEMLGIDRRTLYRMAERFGIPLKD
jgi:DNA-binding NtrC family response regulator